MSKLYFKVASDWQEVVRLRNEISKLETQIKSMDANKAPQAVAVLNRQMQQTKQQMQGMITEAAKAGAVMENDFKSKIYQSSQSVNDFTQKIINQKTVIKNIEADVRRLGESYRSALKNNPLSASGKLSEYTSAKKALDEEKAALFGLTQEQANARLSVKKLRDEYALYRDESKETIKSNEGVGISLTKAFALIGGATAIEQLGSEIIRVRGEFQAADTAIQTLLGSKEKADTLMAQVKEYAKVSPLEFSDVTQATQMMLGFNIEAEKVPRYLRAIGDISMGETGKFNSLTLSFSQMSATGKLMGQDLNQMINAGFNPLQQIAQSTGKSIATLKDEMSKGAISAEMVQQAFMDATSAGGKFFGMSENASKTINGQLSMMQDAMDEVFNEIGTKGEGVIMSGIQATTSLIQNYETVGKILSGLVITYGVYRTAVMLSTIATGKHTIAEVALTNVRVIARRAQMALNASMLTNPYVLLATVVVGAAAAMWAFHDGTTAAEKAQDSYNKKVEDAAQKAQDHKQKLEGLISELQNEVTAETRKMEILDEIKKGYPSLFQKFIDEKGHIKDLTEGWKAYNEEASKNKAIQNKTNVSETKQSIDDMKRIQEVFDKYGYDFKSYTKNDMSLYHKYKPYEAEDLKESIEKNERELSLYEKDVRKDNFIQWKVDLTKQTDKQIEVTRDALVKRAQAANGDKTRLATIGKYIIALDEEKNVRKANSVTYGADFKAAKTEWETAKKEFDAIEKDKDKYTRTQYDNAKAREANTEKAYKDLGGVTGSSLTKQESASEKLRKEQEKLTEEIKKSIQERKELLIQSEMDSQQQQIDMKEEGAEKELAQIQLNYDRQYQEIAKRERELLEKLQAEERKQWEKDNPNYEKKGLKFTPKTTSLTPEQREPFDKEYSLAFQKQEKGTQSMLERLLEKYRDFDAQRTAIEKDGNAEIAYLQAKKTDANAKEIDRAIAVAKQKMKEGIQAVTDTEASKTAEDNPFLKNLFGDTSQMAFKDLQKLVEQAKQVQAYLSGNGDSKGITFISPEQLKAIEKSPAELDKLNKATDNLLKGKKGDEWDDIFEDFTKGLAKVKSAKGFKELSEGMQDIGNSASKASSMIGGVAGNLASMFEEMDNAGAADAMSGVQEAMNAISNIGQGFAKGGIVGGIAAAVGEAANFIGKAFAATARHKAALQEIMNETIAQQREYNLLLMQQNLEYEKATTIFGTDVYGKAINAVTVMKDAVSDLNEELRGSGKYDGGYSFVLGKGIVDTLSKTQRAMMDSYAGLADIEIKTGHKKTGLFGWGKGKDIYSSILSVDEYKDLIDANGKLNIGMAETIINTKTMSDADKAAFQNIIDLAKQAEEAFKAMNDYMTDIFGDLGNTMTDALVDAFVNGTDAAQAFTDSVSGMLETLAKQMVYSVTLGPLLEKTQTRMMDVMKNDKLSNEEKFKQWAGILDGMTDEAIGAQDMANRLLDSLKQSAADNGFDIFSKSKETLDSFVSQMQSAFTSLDVTAKDVSDNIYDYFRQAMINALYEKEYKSKIEELFKDFKDLSSDGLSDSDMAQLGTQVDQYINEMLKGVEGVNNLFADKLKDAADIQSFVDNVKSAMSSIEATAEDVTDNIFEYIRQQMVDKMFADTFQPQIEEFYKKVQAAMSDGSVTDSEKDALRKEAEKLANDITSAKDILSDTLGVTADNLKKEAEAEFKSFSDGILSSLYSAEVTAESISKNIADSMRQELIKAMYIEQYEPRIRAIWDKWKEYSSDGLVTDEERASIKDDINDLSKEVADAAKDISDAWTEAGEAVYDTFESFSNSIKSVLQNAETTAEDVAKNIYQFMRNALVNSMFAEQVQPQIKAWYDKYAEYMKDGAIDTTERKTLDEMIAEIQKAGMEIVDAANGLFPSLDTGAIQEAENARNEAEQEWESFSDSILNSLYDIEASASDISDDMSEYMRKALIKAMYVNNYKPQMQKWYDEWQRAMGDDVLTSEEKQTLDSMKQEMLDGMKKEADAINQMFDSMYSQEASSKGFEGISQDTGEELNGRFTALQIAGEEIKNQTIKQTELLSSINDKLTLRDLTNQNLPLLVAPTLPNIAEQTRSSITNSYQSPMKIVFPDGKLDALTSEVSQLKGIVDEMRTNQFDKFADISEGVSIMAKNTPAMNTKLDNINSNIKKAL